MKLKDILKKSPRSSEIQICEIYILLFHKSFQKIYVTRNGRIIRIRILIYILLKENLTNLICKRISTTASLEFLLPTSHKLILRNIISV